MCRHTERSIAPMLPIASRPITAAFWVSTQNGSMAAAKIKNVQAPELMGWNKIPSSTMPPMWTKTSGFSIQNNTEIKNEEYSGAEAIESHISKLA